MDHRQRCYGRSLGAQNLRSQRNALPPGSMDRLALPIGPSTLGTNEQRDLIPSLQIRGQRAQYRHLLRLFVEQQAAARVRLQRITEHHGSFDPRERCAARLLGSLTRDALPSRQSFRGRPIQPLLASRGTEENEAAHPQLGRLLDEQFEAFEPEQRHVNCDFDQRRRGSLHRLEDRERHHAAARAFHFRQKHALPVGDFVSLARFHPQDPREMIRLVTFNERLPTVDFRDEKPAPRHNVIDTLRFMIAFLRGRLLEKHPNQAIVDAGGVGYDVTIPVSTFSSLGDTGAEVRLRIHTHVREDALQLFGFLTAEEKAIFERLIAVSGIGPKLAITVLSGLPTPELVAAIREGRVEQLVRIPGVGKKTAERLVLELRDKMDMVPAAPRAAAAVAGPDAFTGVDQDVLSALLNLGCQRAAAETAVRKAKTSITSNDFEPLFRRALELVR